MPWAPIAPIGVGSGAAAGADINQQQQNRQTDFVAQLLMHMQQMQAQREMTGAYHDATIQQRREATEGRQQGVLERAAQQIPGGTILNPSESQQYGKFLPGRLSPVDPAMASQSMTGMATLPSPTGYGASTGEVQAQKQQMPEVVPGSNRVAPSLGEQEFTQRQSQAASDKGAQRDLEWYKTQAGIDAKVKDLQNASDRLKMQGDLTSANILRAQAEAALASAKAGQVGVNSKPLSQDAQKGLTTINQVYDLSNRLKQMIEDRGLQKSGTMEKLSDVPAALGSKVQTLGQYGRYLAGFGGDDVTDLTTQLEGLLRPLGTQPYMHGIRNMQYIKQLQEHLPSPAATPSANYQRVKGLLDEGILKNLYDDIVAGEQATKAAPPTFAGSKGGGGGAPPRVYYDANGNPIKQ